MSDRPTAPPTVALVTLGCRVNRSENEALLRTLEGMGLRVGSPDGADLVVVNTCCVTGEAEAKTRKALRREAARPGVRRVVAYGCAAAVFEGELRALGEKIVVVQDRRTVADRVRQEAQALVEALPSTEDEQNPFQSQGQVQGEGSAPMPIERARPNLKIQDGCDHRCSYCIVWRARGPSRSLAASKVEAEVSALSQRGFGEVVLCGVNLGAYGSEGLDLAGLLERLLERTPVGRLRLSSIEPQDVSSRLLEVMASSGGRVAPYLALPLQSGCDRTLRRMGRPCPTAAYAERVAEARSLMPAVAVAADFICGFPGETDRDWAESLDFCRRMGFAAMHVFRYSPRPGTVAATLPDPVPAPIARARSAEARALRDALREHYVASLLGTPQRVLVESAGWGTTGGLVRARVDEALPRDALVDLPARALLAPDTLDCRP